MQHYVMKFVSDLRHVSGFLRVLLFPPPINKGNNKITELRTILQRESQNS
jgi:hypothetical protein